MPKKHSRNLTPAQSNYIHPSLASSKSAPPTASTSKSVNDRLNQLRREQAAQTGPSSSSIEISQRALPPTVRHALNIPEPAPPGPRSGQRNSLDRDRRRIPGPAPPRSWVQGSRHAPADLRWPRIGRSVGALGRPRPYRFSAISLELGHLPPQRSLIDQALKCMARNWEDIVEYEQHYLGSLPVQLKGMLLSYIALYSHEGAITAKGLDILFSHNVVDTTGSEEITLLDLSGQISSRFSVADVKLTRPDTVDQLNKQFATMSLTRGKPQPELEVAESWEDEAEETDSIPKTLNSTRFPNLTHLSLSHPQVYPSWAQLLSLSKQLSKLTHLSLAYWPTPSLSPNSITSSIAAPNGSVDFGGSGFYQELDNDWHEPANIIRRFSNKTYSLRWLDLEGCTWVPALCFGIGWRQIEGRNPASPRVSIAGQDENDDWDSNIDATPCPDWTGSWGQIEYLNISQGTMPSDQAAIRSMPAGVLGIQLLEFLRARDEEEDPASLPPAPPYAEYEWLEREAKARAVARTIRDRRKVAGGKNIRVDHGWTPPVRPKRVSTSKGS